MFGGNFRQKSRLAYRVICTSALFAATTLPVPTMAQDAAKGKIALPLSDAREIGPNSVRFSAAQLSRKGPVIVLFGATTPNWHKARAALQQAVAQGYRINGIIMGPTDEPPSMEIYAKGHHVTKAIDLNQISGPEITRLVRDVCREYYAG